MKVAFAVLGLGICSCFVAAADAQQVSPDVAAILRASLAAQIGSNTPNDVTLSGTVEHIAGADDETVPFLFKALSSGTTRTETSLSAGTLVELHQITVGGPTGSWSRANGTFQAIPGHNLMTDSTWCFPAFIVERLLTDPQAVISFLGTDNGVAHFQAYSAQPSTIAANAAKELQHLSQVDIYLDASTLLPTSFVFNIHPDTNALVDIPVSIQFSGYQMMNGITMPLRVQEYVNGSLASDIRLQTVALNTGLSMSDFAAN
jgi:hypothetical protein